MGQLVSLRPYRVHVYGSLKYTYQCAQTMLRGNWTSLESYMEKQVKVIVLIVALHVVGSSGHGS
jgi:hypothetical protein